MDRAEEHAEQHLSTAMFHHSQRAWMLGRALSIRDGVDLDDELFFVATMLHDLGLCAPVYGRCFTLAGAHAVLDLGHGSSRTESDLERAADAICHHITPGLTVGEGGELGVYVQAGSTLDLGGLRAVHLPVDFVSEVFERYPTDGVKREVGARWRAESALVQHGRAHNLQRWTRFSLMARFGPLPP